MSVVKPALSAEALACLEKLKSLNLWQIAAYLMDSKEGCGWSLPQAFCAIGRYKTFLFVSYLYPQISLVPTREVDLVWHCHILHTRKYRQDCEILFGRFIDHEPDSKLLGEAHQRNFDAAFSQTKALLALFEGYFKAADSGETQLHQADRSESAESQLQPGSNSDKEGLFLRRSACGRPDSNRCESTSVGVLALLSELAPLCLSPHSTSELPEKIGADGLKKLPA